MRNEEGMHIPSDLNIFTLSIPVASQLPHDVGVDGAEAARFMVDLTKFLENPDLLMADLENP